MSLLRRGEGERIEVNEVRARFQGRVACPSQRLLGSISTQSEHPNFLPSCSSLTIPTAQWHALVSSCTRSNLERRRMISLAYPAVT
jgi:hypothetical protein